MYVTILERYGDFDMSYPYAIYLTENPFNLKGFQDSFKQYFNLTIIDNSTQTLDLFIDYIKKTTGLKPEKSFKSYTIAED